MRSYMSMDSHTGVSNESRELCPEGTYPAIIRGVYYCGTHSRRAYQGQEKPPADFLVISVEINKRDAEGRKFISDEKFLISGHENAHLVRSGGPIRAGYPRISKDEIRRFNFRSLEGCGVIVGVRHWEDSKGNTRWGISNGTWNPPMDGMDVGKIETPRDNIPHLVTWLRGLSDKSQCSTLVDYPGEGRQADWDKADGVSADEVARKQERVKPVEAEVDPSEDNPF